MLQTNMLSLPYSAAIESPQLIDIKKIQYSPVFKIERIEGFTEEYIDVLKFKLGMKRIQMKARLLKYAATMTQVLDNYAGSFWKCVKTILIA